MAVEDTPKLRNSKRFIVSFNAIAEVVAESVPVKDRQRIEHLSQMIPQSKNKAVRVHAREIEKLARLRNAIVHNETRPDYVVAEPHDEVVARIERIQREVVTPEGIFPKFEREVAKLQVDDKLSKVLECIKKHNYSQFPVYDGSSFIGLLTESGITRWLTTQVSQDLVSLSDARVGDLVMCEENPKCFKFFPKTATVYDLQEAFSHFPTQQQPRLVAVLITENGRDNQKVMGIVTMEDILAVGIEYLH